MDEEELEAEIKFVKRSRCRLLVMKSLDGKVKMPVEISRQTEFGQKNVSHFLRPLGQHGLVECMNPQARKGRVYRLTEKGNEVLKRIKE